MQGYHFFLFENGVPSRLLSEADVRELLSLTADAPSPVVTPTPDPKPPVTSKPERTYKELVGSLVGHRPGSDIYVSKTGNHYYEVMNSGEVLPRGTDLSFDKLPGATTLSGNPTPNPQWPGVPTRYTLPDGWVWNQFADKAWFIKPGTKGMAGPDWLLAPATAEPTAPALSDRTQGSTAGNTGGNADGSVGFFTSNSNDDGGPV